MIVSIKKWKIIAYARLRIWKIGENIANLISMELGILYNFFMMRAVTWRDISKESGRNLFIQILKFHAAIIMTTILRLALFALLQFLDLYYIINAAIGMLLVSAVNFIVYDTVVFKENR
jgi:putative flippase GtrA